MSEKVSGQGGSGRREKRVLSPSEKYEIWLQLMRQEVTVAQAASAQRVDRSTIMRIKQVAKDGALAALSASKPGAGNKARDFELEQARAAGNTADDGRVARRLPRPRSRNADRGSLPLELFG